MIFSIYFSIFFLSERVFDKIQKNFVVEGAPAMELGGEENGEGKGTGGGWDGKEGKGMGWDVRERKGFFSFQFIFQKTWAEPLNPN